jgi:hypothetical protein
LGEPDPLHLSINPYIRRLGDARLRFGALEKGVGWLAALGPDDAVCLQRERLDVRPFEDVRWLDGHLILVFRGSPVDKPTAAGLSAIECALLEAWTGRRGKREPLGRLRR